jgi:hypothetical protein
MCPELSFEIWRSRLRENCEREGKLENFVNLGDYVLKLFWESGVDPTVQDIVNNGDKVA